MTWRKQKNNYNRLQVARHKHIRVENLVKNLILVGRTSKNYKRFNQARKVLHMLLELLENSILFEEGDKGGEDPKDKTNEESQEDKANEEDQDAKKEGDEASNEDEVITMPKSKYEQKLQEKYAEGARKASKNQEGTKPDEEISEIKKELANYKALNLASDFNIKPEFKDDFVAILKGKGLEINQENAKALADKHPEWKNTSANSGFKIGSDGGETNPTEKSEAERAAALFRL